MNLLKKLLLISITVPLVLMMTACSSSTAPLTESDVPPELTSPCAPLPHLANGQSATLLRWSVTIVDLYQECAHKHDALSKAVIQ